MTAFRRSLLTLLLVGLVAFVTATPALAHTRLKSSNPAEGASLSAAPEAVSLTFSEAVTLPPNPISVTGADGTAWTVGSPTVTDSTVSVPVQPAGPAGPYTVNWSVISDDGDPVTGAVHFALSTAATPTTTVAAAPTTLAAAPAPTAAPSTAVAATSSSAPAESGWPGWLWAVIAVVVLGAAVALVLRSRRSTGSS